MRLLILFCLTLLTTVSTARAPKKLNIKVHLESKCPYCAKFVTDIKKSLNNKAFYDMANIELIPFGKAKVLSTPETSEGGQWKFKCQHGEEECHGNNLENCVLDHFKQKKQMKKGTQAVICLEEQSRRQDKKLDNSRISISNQKCAQRHNYDAQLMMNCANGEQGSKLSYQAAIKKPDDLDAVPYVSVNGKEIKSDHELWTMGKNLLGWVCKKTPDSKKSAQCKHAEKSEKHKLNDALSVFG